MTKVLSSYFKDVNVDQKNLVFCLYGTEYSFIGPNTKGVVFNSAKKIVAGLNHMFDWAYDTGRHNFMNKLNIFFVDLYNYIVDPRFRETLFTSVQSKTFDNIQLASAYYYKVFLNNMDEDIYRGIVEYVDENILENTDDEVSVLDKEEIFLITCIVTITKIMLVGVALLERFKLEKYLFEPLLVATDRFQVVMAEYYYNNKHERGERYEKVVNKDFKNSIYRYFYNAIAEEFERNNVSLFRNNGFSANRIADENYITGLCTISKCVPILVEARTSKQYTLGMDYKAYKFVNKNTVKYLEGVIHNMLGDKLGTPFSGVITTIRFDRGAESDNNYFESAMKRELQLEKKSSSDMNRRKRNIELLKAYLDDKLNAYGLINNITNIPVTPLLDFFIIKLLSEVAEDTLSLKLLDKKTYIKLGVIIQYKLQTSGYEQLARAITCDIITPSDLAKYLDDKMDRIARLRKYHTNPKLCLADIKKIVGYDFRKGNSVMHVTDQFIQFLINDQYDKYKFINDAYIYDYEAVVEQREKQKKELMENG